MATITLNIPEGTAELIRKQLVRDNVDCSYERLKEGKELDFLQALLQHDINNVSVYIEYVSDGGGNSYGDILSDEHLAELVEQLDDPEDD